METNMAGFTELFEQEEVTRAIHNDTAIELRMRHLTGGDAAGWYPYQRGFITDLSVYRVRLAGSNWEISVGDLAMGRDSGEEWEIVDNFRGKFDGKFFFKDKYGFYYAFDEVKAMPIEV